MSNENELPVVLWYQPLLGAQANPDGTCYNVSFSDVPGHTPLVRLADAQRIRDERDELRKSLALVQSHAETAWNRGHLMGIESARQQIDGATKARAQANADRYADNERLTDAMLAAEDERDRLREALSDVLDALGALQKPYDLHGYGISEPRASEIVALAGEKE